MTDNEAASTMKAIMGTSTSTNLCGIGGDKDNISSGARMSTEPAHFAIYHDQHQKFTGGLHLFLKTLNSVLAQFGLRRIITGPNTHRNRNPLTMDQFPYRRCTYVCGSCTPEQRLIGDDEQGCCGFKIRLLLHDTDCDEPYLQVREFSLPPMSKHLIVTPEARRLSEQVVVKNKDVLTPRKVAMIKTLGKNRVRIGVVRNVVSEHFNGVQIDSGLMHRIMKEGRDDAWGKDDQDSMLIFYDEGLKLKQYDERYGVTGKFCARNCNTTGNLLRWYAQTPLNVLNARVYGKDAVWVDTTHNATSFSFKTGPLSVVDWGGNVAPAGIYQVMEEEIHACQDMQVGLELDAPDATCCTDGGSAWPGIVCNLHLRHVEDTFHNEKNAELHASSLPKNVKDQFKNLRSQALYSVMSPARLTALFTTMREVVGENSGCLNWIKRVEEGKEQRTATYTTRNFCCSDKGAASRCEVSMSRLKNKGLAKSDMRKWSLPELMNQYIQTDAAYVETAQKEIELAIKSRQPLSRYVLEREEEESKHVANLKIINIDAHVSNPFHGIQQASMEKIRTHVLNNTPHNQVNHGLSLIFREYNGMQTFVVDAISEGSPFATSNLQAGMRINSINDEQFTTAEKGLSLLNSDEVRITVSAISLASIGTVYTIQHKNRSMKQLSTIHARWHITTSPLYPIVYQRLVSLMEVSGLANHSLPGFLIDAKKPATHEEKPVDETTMEKVVGEDASFKVTVPTCKKNRYNAVNVVPVVVLKMNAPLSTKIPFNSERSLKTNVPRQEPIFIAASRFIDCSLGSYL
jgi:hypothetical protein